MAQEINLPIPLKVQIFFENTAAEIPPHTATATEALFNLAFGKLPADQDSFTGILSKRPGTLVLIKDPVVNTILHASIFNLISRDPGQPPILYHSVSATIPDHHGSSLCTQALLQMVSQTPRPCIVLARTQNPMEIGAFRQAAEKLGLEPHAVCPIFRSPLPAEIAALKFLIETKAPHSSKTIWRSSLPQDLPSFIARGAYGNLSQPNMTAHLSEILDWTKPTASAVQQFMRTHRLDPSRGDAIFIGFTVA